MCDEKLIFYVVIFCALREIYDEDDEDDFEFNEDSITLQEDGSFIVRGDADLEDCNTILELGLDEETLREFGTLSGYLCMISGEIPNVNDFIMSTGWCFEVTSADEKRILSVTVSSLLGSEEDEESSDDEKEDNKERSDTPSTNYDDKSDEIQDKPIKERLFEDEEIIKSLPQLSGFGEVSRILDEATRIERMVENNEAKRIFVKEMKEAISNSEVEEQPIQ